MGMQTEWDLATTLLVQEFAFLWTFLAIREEEGGSKEIDSVIRSTIFQSCTKEGCWRAEITTWESPSKVKEESLRDADKEEARGAAKASP